MLITAKTWFDEKCHQMVHNDTWFGEKREETKDVAEGYIFGFFKEGKHAFEFNNL